MSRNSRRPRRCSAESPRRSDEAFVTGILTSEDDFARALEWQLTDAPDYDTYLRETAELLTDAVEAYATVRARMFHPDDFADYCLLHGLDPHEQAARDGYLVNPPLQTQLVGYRGEELADFLPRLVRAREGGLTLRHADLVMDGALCGAERAAADPRVRWTYQQASEVFRRVLVGAGCGAYEFRVAVDAPGGPLEAGVRVLHWDDGAVRINDEDLDLVTAVLCAGLYGELPGAAVLHGTQGAGALCGEYRQVAWAWRSTGFDWAPAELAVDGVAAGPGFSLGTVV
ncbi:hypothetical protein [Kitasatospora cheerisanensis]|uniref:Uncharacterized protein n=1 Tax=Kitasatospora cheerisanensis KCTC 2395 TaxID=1348663 RepID=A0A066YZE9_9ACTN|nr:hypothetical protein [Kitasatospora cheerisanensis]KDN86923.1 hypothetical protein KCH_13690 [Kitasatospora cheerisanensis KCTC 2395]